MTQAKRPSSIQCARCGADSPVSADGPIPTYCSGKCRRSLSAERARKDGRYDQELAERRRRTAERQAVNARPCPYCGDPMANPRRKQCGKTDCKRAFNAERARQWHRDYTATSGARYGSKYRDRELEYGKRRRQEQPHWRIQYPELGPLVDARRRMLVGQATKGELFAPQDVYERDQWTCGLCLLPVDPALAWPNPMSASVDHVVPLSRGGEHSMGNVQCAHLGCNSSKGDRLTSDSVDAQLTHEVSAQG